MNAGDKVVDWKRATYYGETQGTVVRPVGPYRCLVAWPDIRGEQLEKNADLEVRDGA